MDFLAKSTNMHGFSCKIQEHSSIFLQYPWIFLDYFAKSKIFIGFLAKPININGLSCKIHEYSLIFSQNPLRDSYNFVKCCQTWRGVERPEAAQMGFWETLLSKMENFGAGQDPPRLAESGGESKTLHFLYFLLKIQWKSTILVISRLRGNAGKCCKKLESSGIRAGNISFRQRAELVARTEESK